MASSQSVPCVPVLPLGMKHVVLGTTHVISSIGFMNTFQHGHMVLSLGTEDVVHRSERPPASLFSQVYQATVERALAAEAEADALQQRHTELLLCQASTA
jgi:hypothetical protein